MVGMPCSIADTVEEAMEILRSGTCYEVLFAAEVPGGTPHHL